MVDAIINQIPQNIDTPYGTMHRNTQTGAINWAPDSYFGSNNFGGGSAPTYRDIFGYDYGQGGNRNQRQDYSGGRYVPPTFNWGVGNNGQMTNDMIWNDQRNYYLPQTNYRFPTMPNFGQMMGMFGGGFNPFNPTGGRYGFDPSFEMGGMEESGTTTLGGGDFLDFYRDQQGGSTDPWGRPTNNGYDQNAIDANPEGWLRHLQAMQQGAQGFSPEPGGGTGLGDGIGGGGGGPPIGNFDMIFDMRLDRPAPPRLGNAPMRNGQAGPSAPSDGTKPATEPGGVASLWDQMQQQRSPQMGPRRPMMPQFGQGGNPYMSRFGMGFSPWQMMMSNGNPFYGGGGFRPRGGRRGMGPFGG